MHALFFGDDHKYVSGSLDRTDITAAFGDPNGSEFNHIRRMNDGITRSPELFANVKDLLFGMVLASDEPGFEPAATGPGDSLLSALSDCIAVVIE